MSIKDLFHSPKHQHEFQEIREKVMELEAIIKDSKGTDTCLNGINKLEEQMAKIERNTINRLRELERKHSPLNMQANPNLDDTMLKFIEEKITKRLEESLYLRMEEELGVLKKDYTFLKNLYQKIVKNQSEIQNELNKWKEKQKDTASQPKPIIVQRINVETVHVDKYELNNNFGQLGIKDLSGQLNIGATYESGGPFPFEDQPQMEPSENEGDVTNIPIKDIEKEENNASN